MIFGERLIPVSWAIAALAMLSYLGNYVFGPAMAIEGEVPAVAQDAWVIVLSNALSAVPPTIAALAALWVSISSNRKVRDIGAQTQHISDKTIVYTHLVEEVKSQNEQIHAAAKDAADKVVVVAAESEQTLAKSQAVWDKDLHDIKDDLNGIHVLVNSRLTDALATIEDLKSVLLDMAAGKSGVAVSSETRKRAKAAVKKAS